MIRHNGCDFDAVDIMVWYAWINGLTLNPRIVMEQKLLINEYILREETGLDHFGYDGETGRDI